MVSGPATTGAASRSAARPKLGPPVFGWLVGIGFGAWLSATPCLWLHHATFNARALLPVVRAAAAGDATLAERRLRDFETGFVPDRFLERDGLRCGVRDFRIRLAARSRNREVIHAAVTDPIPLADTESTAAWPVVRRWGVRFEVFHPTETLPLHSMAIRAACFMGDWDTAIGLADELLDACPDFWERIGDIPTDDEIPGARRNAIELLAEERLLKATRALALARRGDLERSRTGLQALIEEPVTLQTAENHIRPELSFLLAAVEFQRGDAEAAEARRREAERDYATPPTFADPDTIPFDYF